MKCQKPDCGGITGVGVQVHGPMCGRIYGYPCQNCGLLHWPTGTPIMTKDDQPYYLKDGRVVLSSDVWPKVEDGSMQAKCLRQSCDGELSIGYIGASTELELKEKGCDILMLGFRRCQKCSLMHTQTGALLLLHGMPQYFSEQDMAKVTHLKV